MKRVTVPFFISHQGCPHTCVFCDQRAITGADGTLPTAGELLAAIEAWRSTAGGRPLDVAFFGGTFTALPEHAQAGLLEPLQPLLHSGAVREVRISTRPDCLDSSQVQWLSRKGVRTIELGVQSADDGVLEESGRGHTAADALAALHCIKEAGLTAGAQLMPGLPGDTPVTSFDSLHRVLAAGADFIRIYPTVVLEGTELARRYREGSYEPLSLERGIKLCTVLLHHCLCAGIPVIRMGLQADRTLRADRILAGCWHPALGQLVRSQLYNDLIRRFVPDGECVTLYCHPSRVSDVVGISGAHVSSQAQRGVRMQVRPSAAVKTDELAVLHDGCESIYSICNDNKYSIFEV